jgi:hypothetical protein
VSSRTERPEGGELRAALDGAEPRPADDADRDLKKNYAQRLSRGLALEVADRLRATFRGITPAGGSGQERPIGAAGGTKRLDVCVWDDRLGLLLDISIKTYSFQDYDSKKRKLGRWTKNVVRNDLELRAEAARIHERQPYAVLIGLMFVPFAACGDGHKDKSSFAHMVMTFRNRTGRRGHDDSRLDRFEAFYLGLYERDGPRRGDVRFFDVSKSPPRNGRPQAGDLLAFDALTEAIRLAVETRNSKQEQWADPEPGTTE